MTNFNFSEIKILCTEANSNEKQIDKIKSLLLNLKPIRNHTNSNDIAFDVIEHTFEAMVKKYNIAQGNITTITDVTGGISYHSGLRTGSQWLFTVHGNTIYELYLKLVLMSFATIKDKNIELR